MNYAIWLAPVGLIMGLVGLFAFLWSMKSGQLEDLDGAAERVLMTENRDYPLVRPSAPEATLQKAARPRNELVEE